jgi:hypothetical protein
MSDPAATTEPMPAPAGLVSADEVAVLEQRVRRLEDVVAQFQDTRQLEERVAERVSSRLAPRPAPEPQPPSAAGGLLRDSAGLMVSAGRTLLPAAATVLQSQANAADTSARSPTGPRAWLLPDAYAELRAIVQMITDRRFRLSWEARIVPLVLLALILTTRLWLPGASVLPELVLWFIDKVLDLVLTYFIYKVLSREAARYRAVAPTLPPAVRF